jgi:hypothetical protein
MGAPRSADEERALQNALKAAFDKRKTRAEQLLLHFTVRLRLLQRHVVAPTRKDGETLSLPTTSRLAEWFQKTTFPQLEKAIKEGQCIVTGQAAESDTFLSSSYADPALMQMYSQLKEHRPDLWIEQDSKSRDIRAAVSATGGGGALRHSASGRASSNEQQQPKEEVVVHTTRFQLIDWKTTQSCRRHEVSELVRGMMDALRGLAAPYDGDMPNRKPVPEPLSPPTITITPNGKSHDNKSPIRQKGTTPTARGGPKSPQAHPQHRSPKPGTTRSPQPAHTPSRVGQPHKPGGQNGSPQRASPTKAVGSRGGRVSGSPSRPNTSPQHNRPQPTHGSPVKSK